MFDNIAPAYDRLNHILSLGIDRRWRSAVVRHLRISGARKILDVATGTGDLAIALAKGIPQAKITGIDLSEQMIRVGESKVSSRGLDGRITLQMADVEHLPFGSGEFDAVTVAFGVRNFENIPEGLAQMGRVLRGGGELVVLEFSTPRNKIFGAMYRFYFHRVLPLIGGLLSKDRKAYRYLPESVDEFPPVSRFLELMGEAGFSDCRSRSLFGGVAHIYIGLRRV